MGMINDHLHFYDNDSGRYPDNSVLRQIQSIDPDGGSVPPTKKDYVQFKERVIRAHGKDAWDRYNEGWPSGEDHA